MSTFPAEEKSRLSQLVDPADWSLLAVSPTRLASALSRSSSGETIEAVLSKLQTMVADYSVPYRELEAVAVPSDRPAGRLVDNFGADRWTYVGDSFFERVSSDGYQKTAVEIYRPRAVAFKRNTQGRIVSMRTSTTEFTLGALRPDGSGGLEVRSLDGKKRMVVPYPEPRRPTREPADSRPNGDPRDQGRRDDKFNGTQELIDFVIDNWKEFKELKSKYKDLREVVDDIQAVQEAVLRNDLSLPPSRNRIVDEMAMQDLFDRGLQAALTFDRKGQREWINELLAYNIETMHWITCRLAGQCDEDGTPMSHSDQASADGPNGGAARPPGDSGGDDGRDREPRLPDYPGDDRPFPPGGGAALVPGPTGLQRLGLSNRLPGFGGR